MAEIHDPEMTTGEGTPPDTRRAIARRALRELAFGTAGWTAGAWVLWRFGHGPARSDVGPILAAALIAVCVAVALKALSERRLPGWPGRRSGDYDVRQLTTGLLGGVGMAALLSIVDAIHTTTSFEAWIGVGLLLLAGRAFDYGPQLLETHRLARLRPSGATPLAGIALVASLCIAGVGAWWIANGIVAGGQLVPLIVSNFPPGISADALADIQPTMPTIALIGWALIVTMAGGGLVLWWAGVPRPSFACLAALYVAEVLWSVVVWSDIGSNELVLGTPLVRLALLQVVSAGLLLAALSVASVLRPRRTLERFKSKSAPRRRRTAQDQLP
ncbi:MAG: hypothetical protein QOF11_2495 [Chloroflexota bacterium]|jgi:hypothetical protein|nr:hypothetical protein [Chloroflexota bacterium]